MLIYYFSCLYFFCFVTVKDDETEKKRRGKKPETEFFILKIFGKKWTQGKSHRGGISFTKIIPQFSSSYKCHICC